MPRSTYTHDVVASNGEYTDPRTGEKKKRYTTIGKGFTDDQGRIAAVDYVQLIRGGKHDNKEAEVSEISHALQELAQDLKIALVVLSQLNVDGDTKHGRVIEEDADAVINIVQDRNKESDTYKQHRFILIAKDRHYGSGGTRVPLILDRSRIRFVEGRDETEQKKSAKKQRFQP